ncbi:MAG TPA: TIGR04283 family arsenosugar biosynthesis glycosyltransferase [Vicinamibacterales bacterium]|nr:TIGR04283 family arsenosugar biosynthesis glycosyltransferase [Vicinamibacterales bacterium]
MGPPLVSVVVPILNDTESLARLLPTLPAGPDTEIIVVNGGALDSRLTTLVDQHRHVSLLSSPAGRGRQMNLGALSGRGRWFLFLHADTQIPAEWLKELQRADRNPSIVAGSFQFQLDSGAWQARVIERAVRWRVRSLDLAYGDQGLFVRRDAFHAVGGYREWPLMEDVDLIRRLRRVGRLYHSPLPAVTSARRWERDGWWRRSAQNLLLQALFFAGASPAWLARRYLRRSNKATKGQALVVMARAPSDVRGKSRLMRSVPRDQVDLKRAILLDTLDVARRVTRADVFVAFEPPAALGEFEAFAGGVAALFPQQGQTLGDRMRHVFAHVFALGYSSAVLIGSDLPTLPSAHVEQALDCLCDGPSTIAIGPAADGGYYLMGLRTLTPELFDAIPWSTSEVLATTLKAAQSLGVSVSVVPTWYDVDGIDDLRRVMAEKTAGRRTRAWIAAHEDFNQLPHLKG